jgi:CheY-like chemotaxis protein
MHSPHTIFLIDDDAIQLKIASKMIERAMPESHITTFPDAKSALDFLQGQLKEDGYLPEVILLDLNMPEMNGWDFLDVFERIRERFSKEIRVYILSSSEDEKDIARSKTYRSVQKYIVKPLTADKIHCLFHD